MFYEVEISGVGKVQIVHRMTEAHKSMCDVFHIFSDNITSPIPKKKEYKTYTSFEPWMGVIYDLNFI